MKNLEMPRNDFLLRDEEELLHSYVEYGRCEEEEQRAASHKDDGEPFRRREPLSDRCLDVEEVVA